MQTPELLLTKLNEALRELRGATRMLEDQTLDERLLPVMRRLTLAELMGSRWLIAVGGTQSAGKTTLLRTLYGLRDDDKWLPANQGQGETLPVLVQESADCTEPQGCAMRLVQDKDNARLYRLDTKPHPLAPDEFAKACRGGLPDVMLPVLKVPRRYFEFDGQALLLLPGYEKRTEKNATWQDLMRQALVGATGCLIVTDATRMASQSQQEIVHDMLANELRTMRPVVVITKTETEAGTPGRLDQLRHSAVEAFGLDGEDALQRVICAGVDTPGAAEPFSKNWLPTLTELLRDLSISGAAARQVQLAQLERTLAADLADALREVRTRALLSTESAGGATASQRSVDALLEAFDDACEDLRKKHNAMAQEVADAHYGPAWERLQDRLEANHDGFVNTVANSLKSVNKSQRRLEGDVLASWGAPEQLLDSYAGRLGKLTARIAGPKLAGASLTAEQPLQRLGYIDAEGAPVKAKFTDSAVQANLRVLMQSRAGEVALGGNEELVETVRMLPLMALEYARIAMAVPQLVQVDTTTLEKMPQADLNASAANIRQQFGEFSDTTRSILQGIAAVMAVDVAADGHADIIDTLLASIGVGVGSSTAAAGLTIGGAVAATVAIGYLAHSAVQEVRRHEGQVRELARRMLQHSRDRHELHFATRFDDLMAAIRARLADGLRQRHGLDRHLVEQERLAKALVDVRTLQQDLLSQLDASGRALLLFERAPA
jgi:hypothetical protein